MSFLKFNDSNDRLNWHEDNGINFSMINDYLRNHFYEKVLSKQVYGRDCVDIGFGTGLLSMIALKHGATRIIAYEENVGRFRLGCKIIKDCGLIDKIDLRNEKFTSDMIDQFKGKLFYHEIVGERLWNEDLFSALPKIENVEFLPNRYSIELYMLEIPKNLFLYLYQNKFTDYFNPCIDVSEDFIDSVNKFASNGDSIGHNICKSMRKTFDITEDGKLRTFEDTFQQYYDNDNLFKKIFISTYGMVHTVGYTLDTGKQYIEIISDNEHTVKEIDRVNKKVSMIVSKKRMEDKCVLFIPRYKIGHNEDELYLDICHWNPELQLAMISKTKNDVKITHDLTNGKITYELT